jgi:L-threonylcarbamoyladenylate synthase
MNAPVPSSDEIERAAVALRAGALVAFPTETVYGLGADATNDRAVAAIFATKGRPRFNPLIVHVPDMAAARRIGVFTETAEKLAQAFLPGSLSLVVSKTADAGLSDLVSAGLDTVAIRIPAHPVAQALLRHAGRPIAAPSANRSGHVSATTAEHVRADLGDAVSIVLDAGPTMCGLESTVVDAHCDPVTLLRPGAVTSEKIATVLGYTPARPSSETLAPTSPGQLASHYAPRAKLRMNAITVARGEALLAFGPTLPAHDGPTINLSHDGDVTEAAINLFAALRALDRPEVAAIAVMPIPEIGLGEAINDRLIRAAAPREPN